MGNVTQRCEVDTMARRRGQGEGSLEELPSGKWRAIFTNGKRPDGGQRKVSATFETRREAAFWLNEQLDMRRKGTLVAPSRILLAEWLRQWLRGLRGRLANGTWHFYQTCVDKYLIPEPGDCEMGQLSPMLIHQMHARLTEKGLSSDRQHKIARTLRTALEAARKMRLIYGNPALDVQMPRKAQRQLQTWTTDEVKQLLRTARGERLYPFYVLALDTGMRQGELLGLHWPEVDLVEGTVLVKQSLEEIGGHFHLKEPKTAKGRRRIWIGQTTVEVLKAHRERLRKKKNNVLNGPVFPNYRGHNLYIAKSNLSKAFMKVVQKAGVRKIRPNDLRHTSATLMLQAGANLKMVSERLGHESVEITLRFYVGVLPGEQQKASQYADWLLSHQNPTQPNNCSEDQKRKDS
jgi:integrase